MRAPAELVLVQPAQQAGEVILIPKKFSLYHQPWRHSFPTEGWAPTSDLGAREVLGLMRSVEKTLAAAVLIEPDQGFVYRLV